MKKTILKITDRLSVSPNILFLIDSIGALLIAFFLFVVMRNFDEYFGMPPAILTYLSVIAVCFCLYSTSCFLTLKQNRIIPYLKTVSIANLLYCMLTLGLVITYYPNLTTPGKIYFLIEIAIICGLGYIELNVANTIKLKQKF